MPNNQFGDFQTPVELAEACLSTLNLPTDARILEPTCGNGAFLDAAERTVSSSDRHGIEINEEHARRARRFGIVDVADIFSFSFDDIQWKGNGRLFIIGNPPWVTASELKRMGGQNIPKKSNFKHMRGFDALLGASNFDICEFIILEMLAAYRQEPITLGMLCKTQVARNVIEYAAKNGFAFAKASIYRIDAMRWFGAAVDACWFVMESNPGESPDYICNDYSDLDSNTPSRRFGFCAGQMVADVDAYSKSHAIDGRSPLTWRSGIKHDAAKVFELKAVDGHAVSSFGDIFEVDNRRIYPLMKSSDVSNERRTITRYVIVPQERLSEDTEVLKDTEPDVWSYLDRHGDVLDARHSTIYQGKPRFSIFGLGDYTFADYKIAVSGFYKEPRFQLIAPFKGKPVVFDDTCYFLSFTTFEEAAIVWALLSDEQCMGLIKSLCFTDSKRPVTKKLLQRIDYSKAIESVEATVARAAHEADRLEVPFDQGIAYEFCRTLGTGAQLNLV